jgi:hypothetical protein
MTATSSVCSAATNVKTILAYAGLSLITVIALAGCGGAEGAKLSGSAPFVAPLARAVFCGPKGIRGYRSPGNGVRLAINRQYLHPGDEATIRILNDVSQSIEFGFKPIVEKSVNGKWQRSRLMVNGIPIVFASPQIVISGRSQSRCLDIPIPIGWRAGKYRVRQLVVIKGGEANGDARILSAPFQIMGVQSHAAR